MIGLDLFIYLFYLFQYAGINIGPVHKKDVMKASTMLEHDPQYVFVLHLHNCYFLSNPPSPCAYMIDFNMQSYLSSLLIKQPFPFKSHKLFARFCCLLQVRSDTSIRREDRKRLSGDGRQSWREDL